MTVNTFLLYHYVNRRWHTYMKSPKNPTKYKMRRCSLSFMTTVIILASLPYSCTLSLPSGDPAPGRSPGPPKEIYKETELKEGIDKVTDVYDETTTSDEVLEITTVGDVSVSERTVGDACAFARIPSDSDEIVTVSDQDSEVNLTVTHPVFDADELVRGVIYDGE